MHRTQTLFQLLGFDVQSLENGVYHLTRFDGKRTVHYVALIHTAKPAAPPGMALQLFMVEAPQGEPIHNVIRHWLTLDARRLAESGIEPLFLDWSPITEVNVTALEYRRPDGRVRYAVALSSGDVVCYN